MEKLVVVRTNPTQGHPVKVQFREAGEDGDRLWGTGEFPFPLWLQFEKLVKDGMEARARVETMENRRIEVVFRPTVENSEAPAPKGNVASPTVTKIARSLGGVSNIAREESEE